MNRKYLRWGLLTLLAVGAVLAIAGFGVARWYLKNTALTAERAPLTQIPPTQAPDNSGGCYYNWATQSLPELSRQVQSAVHEILPQAQARAEAFGEDCIYADGHRTFGAMETDYFVSLEVRNLNDPVELGGLVRKTMDLLLERFPVGSTPGPQPGRVTFHFSAAGEESNRPVLITDYQALPPSLSDAELYQALSK